MHCFTHQAKQPVGFGLAPFYAGISEFPDVPVSFLGVLLRIAMEAATLQQVSILPPSFVG